MRYIDKSNLDQVFEKYAKQSRPTSWDNSSKSKRKGLAQHLYSEQECMCAYCQDNLPQPVGGNKNEVDISHIDHILPKSKYPELEFEQSNLVLSCKGYAYKSQLRLTEKGRISKVDEHGLKREFCGCRKDNHPELEFIEANFLSPTKIQDIEDYFYYEIEGYIQPHPNKTIEKDKIEYTIKLLNLNHNYLIEQRKKELDCHLNDENYPKTCFYSMLKQYELAQ
jgi:uncharacterized protein (TIGR02646 family)